MCNVMILKAVMNTETSVINSNIKLKKINLYCAVDK